MIRRLTDEERAALNALVDGELDAGEARIWVGRIASDPDLAAARDEIVAVRDAMKRLDRPEVSPEFLRRIENLASPPRPAAARPTRHWTAGLQNIAAAVVVSALLASSATYYFGLPHGASFEALIADAHRRSLLAASPVDVLSADRHTVKPWLDARIGISPPAPDLAAEGYKLVGGRVEVLGQQTLPTLVYRHNEHTISLVARPDAAASSPASGLASGGYNMVEWRGGGVMFAAISDLEPDELEAFVADYRAAAEGRLR